MNIEQLRELIKDLPSNLPVRIAFENPYGDNTVSNGITGHRVQRDALYLEGLA